MKTKPTIFVLGVLCACLGLASCNRRTETSPKGQEQASANTAPTASSAPAATPAPLQGEEWSRDWQVLANDKQMENAKIDAKNHGHGWFPGEVEPQFGNRPPFEGAGKHSGILILHPLSGNEPAKTAFIGRLEAPNSAMFVTVAGSVHGDFVLRCVANGETVKEYTLDGKKWTTCEFDLSPFAGKPAGVELWCVPGGAKPWYFETCYIDQIKFGPPQSASAGTLQSAPASPEKPAASAANATPAPGPLVFESSLYAPDALDSLYRSYGQYGGRAVIEAGNGLRLGKGHTAPMVWAKPFLGDKYRVRFEVQLNENGWAGWTLCGPGYGNSPDSGYACQLDKTRFALRRDGSEVQTIDLPESAAGKWASVQADVGDGKIAVTLDTVPVAQFTDPQPLTGPLHGWFGLVAGESAFRNLRIWSPSTDTKRERQLTPPETEKPVANRELLFELKQPSPSLGSEWHQSQPQHVAVKNGAVQLSGPNGTPALILTQPLTPEVAYEVEFEYPTDEAVNLSLMLWFAEKPPQTAKECAGGWKVDLPIGNGNTTIRWHNGPADAPEENFETRGEVLASTPYYAPVSKRKYVARLETHGNELRVFLDGGLVLTGKRPADAAAPAMPLFAGMRQFYGGSLVRAVRIYRVAQ